MALVPRFIQRISQQQTFKLVDASTGDVFTWDDVMASPSLPDLQHQLAFLYLDRSVTSVIAFFRCYAAGATLALLPGDMPAEAKADLENSYAPSIIYDPLRNDIEGMSKHEDGPSVRYFMGEQASTVHPQIKILISTSGSTGSPKLVKLSEENLLANADQILAYLPILATDVVPMNLPIHYSYGLSVLTTHALKGGTIVCGVADVIQKAFWEQWERFGFSSMAGVPFSYEMLNRLGFFEKELPTLRYFTQAGGKMNEALVTKAATFAAARHHQFYVMYGQTEATARMAYLPPEMALQRPTSIGIAIPGGRFRIDATTQELIYSGPNVFGGYAMNRDDLDQYESPAELYTGDLARMDEDGYVYITGRSKRFVKLFGNRIGLDELEALIKDHYSGTAIACDGVADKYVLITHEDASLDKKALSELLFEQAGIHPTAIRWNHLASIPLTATGKTDHQKILKEHEGR